MPGRNQRNYYTTVKSIKMTSINYSIYRVCSLVIHQVPPFPPFTGFTTLNRHYWTGICSLKFQIAFFSLCSCLLILVFNLRQHHCKRTQREESVYSQTHHPSADGFQTRPSGSIALKASLLICVLHAGFVSAFMTHPFSLSSHITVWAIALIYQIIREGVTWYMALLSL